MTADDKILKVLEKEGNLTVPLLAEKTGHGREYVFQRIRILIALGQVRKVGRGLYALSERKG